MNLSTNSTFDSESESGPSSPTRDDDDDSAGEREGGEEDEEKAKMGRMRVNVLNEVVRTERDYITDIGCLVKVFLFPISATNTLKKEDMEAIFSNIEDVVPIHIEFLKKLEEKLSEAEEEGMPLHEVAIGDIFIRFFHYFKLYSIYASNHDASLMKLEECKKKRKEFARFLDVCHGDTSCRGLFLNAFLIKPIQRLCKYPLLLRELIKFTPEEHPDHEQLKEANERVSKVMNYVNEAKRLAEGMARTKAIAEKFGLKDLVREDRILHHEGRVKNFKKGSKDREDRYLFVFSDLILIMKPVGKKESDDEHLKFKMVAQGSLSTAKIINISDLPEDNLYSAFEVVLDNLRLTLCANTEKEKNQWVKAIKASIKEFQRQTAFKMKKQKEMEALNPTQESPEFSSKKRKKDKKEKSRSESKIKGKSVSTTSMVDPPAGSRDNLRNELDAILASPRSDKVSRRDTASKKDSPASSKEKRGSSGPGLFQRRNTAQVLMRPSPTKKRRDTTTGSKSPDPKSRSSGTPGAASPLRKSTAGLGQPLVLPPLPPKKKE